MNAREFTIHLPVGSVHITHFNERAFANLLEQNAIIRIDKDFNQYRFSRIYQDKDKAFFLEFYFGGAIKILTTEDLDKIKRVTFWQMATEAFGDEITYSISLAKEEYQLMIQNTRPYTFEDEFFSKHVISCYVRNDGSLLMHGDDPFEFNGFHLYEGLKTLAGLDFYARETFGHLIEIKQNEGTYLPLYKEGWQPFNIHINTGKNTNVEEARILLSKIFNIDLELLDYTKESLEALDKPIVANWNRVDSYDARLPLLSYMGEILARDHKLMWTTYGEGNQKEFLLYNRDGFSFEIENSFHRHIEDMLMFHVSGGIRSIERELLDQKNRGQSQRPTSAKSTPLIPLLFYQQLINRRNQ